MARTIFGTASLARRHESGPMRINLAGRILQVEWSHSGLTADYIAEAVSARFKGSKQVHNTVRHEIGFLANELIENAIKFGSGESIGVEASVEDDTFRISVTNIASAALMPKLINLLTELSSGEPQAMLLEQLEANALESESNASGLGLLTLLADYGARMAWQIEDLPGEVSTKISTHAAITVPNHEAQHHGS
ncbi:slr1658 superfamily regulator [Pararhizobium sp. PWRC1-1]|uniref:slr1658 superfamily regulator n=1 Tax=Pararhizobium sp. PWRC1-1 TaxID=2804566 RepID=UPI003CEFA49F